MAAMDEVSTTRFTRACAAALSTRSVPPIVACEIGLHELEPLALWLIGGKRLTQCGSQLQVTQRTTHVVATLKELLHAVLGNETGGASDEDDRLRHSVPENTLVGARQDHARKWPARRGR